MHYIAPPTGNDVRVLVWSPNVALPYWERPAVLANPPAPPPPGAPGSPEATDTPLEGGQNVM